MKEDLVKGFKDNPSTSTRDNAAQIDVSYKNVFCVLHDEKMHPFHVQRVQQLSGTNYAQLVDFVRWLLHAIENDPQIYETTLFTDEAMFTVEGVVKTHNAHTWTSTNSHTAFPSNAQQRFSMNTSAVILFDYLIRPYLLSEHFNGNICLAYLQNILTELLQHLPGTL